ncbi:sel1 repeat family protein [Shewanella sp. JNE10-2]|jgi:hypothetical protein|uniref:tetratricopeptide repeat protein n=2 Tax=Pseudomonadota TaxID=1224 RepID=UPI0020049137|nr:MULTISPECIES: tetratricopeptide repeat protein [unclassified Shewanella]MCK7632244.1 sel1 repeat family protein [Shewanella sp. JNE9-1]MCK7647489.1 sel1 repeat family protein [Shewanella sp. JNE3-1]MCK7655554.1 sel1 repeat family protein [Shewanella sp. JNE4-1]UPO26866.1 sel1 repeat family protein [Shewanella sp. JNE10-2]UPO34063.1 sel1 repeat family protein [Shewanella sp. JNE7]
MKKICILLLLLPLTTLAYDRSPEGGLATIDLCLANNLMTQSKWEELAESIVLQEFNGNPSTINTKAVDNKKNWMIQMFGLQDLRGLCMMVNNQYRLSSEQKKALINSMDSRNNEIQNLQLLAEKGDSESQFELAKKYTEIPDVKSAVIWFEKSAQQGHIEAQYQLADILSIGKWGYPKDKHKAIYWYKEAYKNGSGSAYSIAHAYYYLKPELESNLIEALAWYSISLEQMNARGVDSGGVYEATRKNIDLLNSKLSGNAKTRASKMSDIYKN